MKQVPWLDWQEWTQACSLLKQAPLSALPLLQRWRLRLSLPIRVECTRLILSTLSGTINSFDPEALIGLDQSRRLSVCMCLVRVVNQLCDLAVPQKDRSFATKALIMDLPEYLVDLRHASTHGELPDSYLVSRGIFDLFDWLMRTYWEVQQKELSQSSSAVAQIKKYSQRAKATSDLQRLATFIDNLNIPKSNRPAVAERLARCRKTMSDESWGLLFLKLKPGFPKLAESVLQAVLQLAKKGKRTLGDATDLVQDFLGLEEKIQLATSPALRHLVKLNNNDQAAHNLLGLLVSSGMLEEGDEVRKLWELSSVGRGTEGVFPEAGPLPLKRWRSLKVWKARPIGSQSVIL